MDVLARVVTDAKALLDALGDPPTGGDALASAVAAVRHLPIQPDAPGVPGVTVTLLSPDSGVPRPPGPGGPAPIDSTGPGDLAVSPPLPAPGPAGPQGDPGPQGDRGPAGPGVDPARVALIEAAIRDLQAHQLTALILAT